METLIKVNDYVEAIEICVANNDIVGALSILKSISARIRSEDFSINVIMLDSRFDLLTKNNASGLINNIEYNLELNRIKYSILEIVYRVLNRLLHSLTTDDVNINIAKAHNTKIGLNYKRTRTGEIFFVEAEVNLRIDFLTRQLLISVGFNTENELITNRYFDIGLYKEETDSRLTKLPGLSTIEETCLVNGDTVLIRLEPTFQACLGPILFR